VADSHALLEPASILMSTTHTRPAITTPAPTPANRIPVKSGRRSAASRSRHQALTWISAQALDTPAASRSASHAGMPSAKAMARVARPVASSEARTARTRSTRCSIAHSAPMR